MLVSVNTRSCLYYTYLDCPFAGVFQVAPRLIEIQTMKLPGGMREWDQSSLEANSLS